MGMSKAIRKQAVTAERAAAQTADDFVANQMKSLAQAFRAQAELAQEKEENEEEKMSFTVRAKCKFGEISHRFRSVDAALRKAKELSKSRCYDIHIVTPEGRDYHSSEFGDLPRISERVGAHQR